MNVKIENVEKNVIELEIEVDKEIFEEGMQKSFRKNAGKFSVPGFRKGKAPRNIIERYYGEEVLYEDAINIVCADAYDKAIEENKIIPVDRPEIDIKQIGKGENLIFTAKVAKKPEVELGEYKGVEVEKVEAEVSDEDVENELKAEADRNSRMITIEDRPVQTGDIVNLDFEGFVNGEAFKGGKGENYELEIGSGHFIPGFEEQLVGLNRDDEKEVNVTFPEDYNSDELKGKPAVFKVKIRDIKLKEIPAIDDEFAQDVSEFDSLEDYKKDIKEKLLKQAEQRAKQEFENNLISKILENTPLDIPEAMISLQTDNMLYDYDMRLRYQGLDLANYLKMMGQTADEFKKHLRADAEREVKTELVLEKITEVEAIEVSDEDVDKEIERMAEEYKQSKEELEKKVNEQQKENIKQGLKVRKTIDFLVENAKVVESEKQSEETEQKE